MRKVIILIICFQVLFDFTRGQVPTQSTNNFFDKPTNYLYPAILAGAAIYYIVKYTKNHHGSYKASSNNENAKLFKKQVRSLSKLINNNNFSVDSTSIQKMIEDIQELYETSFEKDKTFYSQVKNAELSFANLKSKYANYIYDTYYPGYSKAKESFYTNIKSDINSAKINLATLLQLKQKLCWNKYENTGIIAEVNECSLIISTYDNFQTKLAIVQKQIIDSNTTYPDFNELYKLMNKWNSLTKLSSSKMQLQIDEQDCQYHKILYAVLYSKSESILNQLVTSDELLAFNESIESFYSIYKNVNSKNCVGINKFYSLKNIVASKDSLENKKIADEVIKVNKETYKKIRLEKPLEIQNIILIPNEIGVPVGYILVKNNTDETITAIDAWISCYDAMGRSVNYFLSSSNTELYTFKTNLPSTEINPLIITFNLNDEVQSIDVKITSVRYEDGTIVKLKNPIKYIPNTSK